MKTLTRLWVFTLLFCFLFSAPLSAQLFVDGSFTAEEMVTDFFHHPDSCVSISNVTYTGAAESMGFFDGSASNLGLDAGIMLSSGHIEDAIGPNDQGGAGTSLSENGDSDLNALLGGFDSYDAAVLEFDIVSTEPLIEFEYVFGSEEYLEFVDAGFNDAFAFLVSGPGITGQQNIALIPGTTIPVAIDNVNDNDFPIYYIDNGTGNPPSTPDTIQYDGFTTVLSAPLAIIPGETYHIKLVVADVGDEILDSGVFISIESLCGSAMLAPTSDFAPEPMGGPGSKTINFDNAAKYGTAWHWDFGDGNTSEERYPSHTYANDGVYQVTLETTNFCCTSTTTLEVVAGNATGIESANTSGIAIYPNPAYGTLHIHVPQNEALTFRLFDATGKLLLQENANSTTPIDLSAYGKGLFFVEIIGDNTHFTQKVVNQ